MTGCKVIGVRCLTKADVPEGTIGRTQGKRASSHSTVKKAYLAKPGIEPRTSIIGICCVPASTQLNLQHGLQINCIKMKSDIDRILRAGVSVQSIVYPALVSATTRLERD